MPNWAFFLMRLTLGIGASALMTWGGNKLGGFVVGLIAFVMSTPIIGVAIAKPLVEMIHEGFGWLSAQRFAASSKASFVRKLRKHRQITQCDC